MISLKMSGRNIQIFDMKSSFSIFGRKSVYSSIFLVLILCSCVLAFSFPTTAAENDTVTPGILISNESTVLRNGETYRFLQGYEVTLKGFGAENVLFEIYCNDSNLISYYIGSTDLKEGETIQCYRRTKTGIDIVFMMTLERMYLNNSEIIAEFSHIYQYTDSGANDYPLVSDWIIYTDILEFPPSGDLNDSDQDHDSDKDLSVDPTLIISGAILVLFLIIFLYFHSNKKK